MKRLMVWFRKTFPSVMAVPILKRTAIYALGALGLAYAWRRFVSGQYAMSHVFSAFCIFFLAASWFHYLALDGLRAPFRKKEGADQPSPAGKSFADLLNSEPEPGEESNLTARERTLCSLAACVLCFLLYLILALL